MIKQILATSIISSVIFAQNICFENLLFNLSNTPNIDIVNQKEFVLNNEANKQIIKNGINTLRFYPYNEEQIDKTIKHLIEDRESRYFINSKEEGFNLNKNDTLINNIENINPLINSLMWINNPQIKIRAVELINAGILAGPSVYIHLVNPSYKTLLTLDNIGFFEYKEDRDDFIKKMSKTVSDADLPFYMFYTTIHNNFSRENFSQTTLGYLDKYIDNKTCIDTNKLIRFKENYDYTKAMISFFISRIFPEKANDLKFLIYESEKSAGVWNFLEYNFYLIQKDNIKAAKAMELLMETGDKKPFLRQKSAEIFYAASFDYFKANNFFASWNYSLKTLENLSLVSKLSHRDIEIATNAKKILQDSASQIAENFNSLNEFDNADLVTNKTAQWIAYIFNSSERHVR